MDVILLEKVENLGGLGDVVSVKAGYGRNYLIPGKKAVPATTANRTNFDERRAELEAAAAALLATANARGTVLSEKAITIACKVGEEGKLFGSVGTADIAAACTEAGTAIDKHEVRLPDGAFRHIGEYKISIHLHPEVNAEITVQVVADEA